MTTVKQETNKFKRLWIWFWYNDVTRFLLVMFPGHFILTIPLLAYFSVDGAIIKNFAIGSYIFLFVFAMCDNDYTNLNRIGLDTSRKPLRKPL